MSRKVITFIVSVLVAILAFLHDKIGISLDAGQTAAGLAGAAAYLLGQARIDVEIAKREMIQNRKFLDPAFLTGLLAVILPVVNGTFGFKLPVELISSTLAAILVVILKRRENSIVKQN
jgi:hypothetical protein